MNVVNIRRTQELLGHSSVETAMIYTHVVKTLESVPESLLDRLPVVVERKARLPER